MAVNATFFLRGSLGTKPHFERGRPRTPILRPSVNRYLLVRQGEKGWSAFGTERMTYHELKAID